MDMPAWLQLNAAVLTASVFFCNWDGTKAPSSLVHQNDQQPDLPLTSPV